MSEYTREQLAPFAERLLRLAMFREFQLKGKLGQKAMVEWLYEASGRNEILAARIVDAAFKWGIENKKLPDAPDLEKIAADVRPKAVKPVASESCEQCHGSGYAVVAVDGTGHQWFDKCPCGGVSPGNEARPIPRNKKASDAINLGLHLLEGKLKRV